MWGSLALGALVVLIQLVRLLGQRRFHNGSYGTPFDVVPDGKDADYAEMYQELMSLGFEPLGIYWESLWFLKFKERAFRSPKRDCVATMYKLLDDPWEVGFLTVFTDGAAVFTSNSEDEGLDTD